MISIIILLPNATKMGSGKVEVDNATMRSKGRTRRRGRFQLCRRYVRLRQHGGHSARIDVATARPRGLDPATEVGGREEKMAVAVASQRHRSAIIARDAFTNATGRLINRLKLATNRLDGLEECTREMYSLAMHN